MLLVSEKLHRKPQSFSRLSALSVDGLIGLILLSILSAAACSINDDLVNSHPSSIASDPVVAVSDRNCDFGFCFTVIGNRTDIKDWRFIHVVLNEEDFSLDKIRMVVRYLSKEYTQPNQTAITIATDPDFFKQSTHIKYYVKMAYFSRRSNGKVKLEYTESVPTDRLTEVDVDPQ